MIQHTMRDTVIAGPWELADSTHWRSGGGYVPILQAQLHIHSWTLQAESWVPRLACTTVAGSAALGKSCCAAQLV